MTAHHARTGWLLAMLGGRSASFLVLFAYLFPHPCVRQ